MDIGEKGGIGSYCVVPDLEGGVWVVYEQFSDILYPVIRVQGFDADGLRRFGVDGLILTKLDERHSILNAFQTSDNGLMVAFISHSDDKRIYSQVYAQKFGYNGNRIYGAEGIRISDSKHECLNFTFPAACSDGSDGFFAYYADTNHSNDVYICGVNSEGSRKFDPVFIGSGLNQAKSAIGEDGRGGMFIAWEATDHRHQILTQRISPGGVPEWKSPEILLEPGSATSMNIMPDGSGGVYFIDGGGGKRGAIIQRILSDGSLPWGIKGVVIRTPTGISLSKPVLMEDGSAAVFAAGSSEAFLIRLLPDGKPCFESNNIIVDQSKLNTDGLNPVLISSRDRKYLFAFLLYSYRNNNVVTSIKGMLFSPDGFDLWADKNMIIIDKQPGHHYTVVTMRGVLTENGAIVLAARSISKTSKSQVRLFHIPSDGVRNGESDEFHFLDIDSLKQHVRSKPELAIIRTLPDIDKRQVSITVSAENSFPSFWKVYNLKGQLTDSFPIMLSSGVNQFNWIASKTAKPGIYFLNCTSGKELLIFEKVVLLDSESDVYQAGKE